MAAFASASAKSQQAGGSAAGPGSAHAPRPGPLATAFAMRTPGDGEAAIAGDRSAGAASGFSAQGGAAIDPFLRSYLGPAPGLDEARLHTGADAAGFAAAIGASAFTVGAHIGLAENAPRPDTGPGVRLLVHELAHVAQTGARPLPPDAPWTLGRRDAPEEDDARSAARAFALGGIRARGPESMPVVRRGDGDDAEETGKRLGAGEDFKWIGSGRTPTLFLKKEWLLKNKVPSGAEQIGGDKFPDVVRPVMEAYIALNPWAQKHKDKTLARIAEVGFFPRKTSWAEGEIEIRTSRTILLFVGLPVEKPIEIFPNAGGIEVYADLATLYPEGADAAAIESSRTGVAEKILAGMEAAVGGKMIEVARVTLRDLMAKKLHAEAKPQALPFTEAQMRVLFGEAQWNAYLEKGGAEGGGEGESVGVFGGEYGLPRGASKKDIAALKKLLVEIFGPPLDPAPPGPKRPVSAAEIKAILKIDKHPQRDKLIAIIRAAREKHGRSKTESLQDMLEMLIQQVELDRYSEVFGIEKSTDPPDQEPVVFRPVRGEIESTTGLLVPKQEAHFEFKEHSKVDALRVPHVAIRWYAIKKPKDPTKLGEGELIDEEITKYIELDEDSILNDRIFEVTFPETGIYEIHAIVQHNFYLPGHFMRTVEVKTQTDRLDDMQKAAGGGIGKTDKAGKHSFKDVASEDSTVALGMGGVGGAVVLAIAGGTGHEEGTRSEGTLDEANQKKKGNYEESGQTIGERIKKLEELVTHFKGRSDPESADLAKWAEERIKRLRETGTRLIAVEGDQTNLPVLVQGMYVSRVSGTRGGPLDLVCWVRKVGEKYEGHLFDYSELVRPDHFHFEASAEGFERVMEKLFFELTSTYPNGALRFSFQVYEGTTPTKRFVRFERETDTLLKDVRNVVFSRGMSLAVNLITTVLTVFPPTAPIGIAVSFAYNGAATALEFRDAARTGTIRASNYVDIGLVALDLIPILGKARLLRVGQKAYRVIDAAQLAGAVYMFTAEGYHQAEQLRDGELTDLAELRAEIEHLERVNASDPSLAEKKKRAKEMEAEIRGAAAKVFSDMALDQGLTIASQSALRRAAERHLVDSGPHGQKPTSADPGPTKRSGAADADPNQKPTSTDDAPPKADKQPVAIEREAHSATYSGNKHPGVDVHLQIALPADLQHIPAIRDPSLTAHEVRVHYSKDALGLVTDVHVRAGPDAGPDHIAAHVKVVRLMNELSGISGAARMLYRRLRALLSGSKQPPPVGSKAFEASLEIEKLPAIIEGHARTLHEGGLDPETMADVRAEKEHLEAELRRHQETLAQMELEQGEGFVAAKVPKSNAAAVAAKRPALDGPDNPAPGHYYYESSPGNFELRKYTHSKDPAKRLVFEDGKWKIEDRPEGPRTFESFKKANEGSHQPLTDFPELDDALAKRFIDQHWTNADQALVWRWGKVIQKLHKDLGGAGAGLIDRFLAHLGQDATEGQYGKMRRDIRKAIVDHALTDATGKARTTAERARIVREYLALMPEQASSGALFTSFRTSLLGAEGSPLSYMHNLPDASLKMPNENKFADGAVQVKKQVEGGPPPGRYLVDDKAGKDPFDFEQATYYSKAIQDGWKDFNGLVYMFENEGAAKAAFKDAGTLHERIHIAFMDVSGEVKWLR